jgi:hypothetical protein
MTVSLFRVDITRKDRASLPAGSAVGFSYLIDAVTAEQAERMATERFTALLNADLLFIERVDDVTPPVSCY